MGTAQGEQVRGRGVERAWRVHIREGGGKWGGVQLLWMMQGAWGGRAWGRSTSGKGSELGVEWGMQSLI